MAGSLDLFKLDGRVAIVTGGAKSIGLYYSTALAEAGAKVVVADIDAEAVRGTSAQLNELHPGCILGVDLDVASRASIADMVRRVDEHWGRLDILINNAALCAALPVHSSPWGIPEQEWADVMTVNIRGTYDCIEGCLPLLQRNGWGRIINVASNLAFLGSANNLHYSSTKGAIITLTHSLAPVLGPQGITVNALAPGFTMSPSILARQAALGTPPANPGQPAPARRNQRIIDRAEVPEDLIGSLLYLASPASDFVTGQTIICDGGTYLH